MDDSSRDSHGRRPKPEIRPPRRDAFVSNTVSTCRGTRRGSFCRVKVSQPARNRVVPRQWIDLVHLCSRRRPRNALDRSWPTLESRPLLLLVYRFLPCACICSRETYIRIYIPGMDEKSVERTLSSNYRISSLVPFSVVVININFTIYKQFVWKKKKEKR